MTHVFSFQRNTVLRRCLAWAVQDGGPKVKTKKKTTIVGVTNWLVDVTETKIQLPDPQFQGPATLRGGFDYCTTKLEVKNPKWWSRYQKMCVSAHRCDKNKITMAIRFSILISLL